MIEGKLMFDVTIEPQKDREAINNLAFELEKVLNKVNGVDFAEVVDEELNEHDEPEDE